MPIEEYTPDHWPHGFTGGPCERAVYSGSNVGAQLGKQLVRTFSTGATRDTDENKLDYEGFLSPLVLKRYAEHMHAARKLPDGSLRNSDNWQLGISKEVYMKSMWRHFFAVWTHHRDWPGAEGDIETELCALLFNAQGMLHEILKAKQ